MIRGFIYDNTNGELIPFQKVLLIPTEKEKQILGATTDVDGFFSFPKVELGTYLLKVQNNEFVTHEREINVVKKDGITDIRIELVKPDNVTDIEEFVVSAETKRKTTEVLISVNSMSKKDVERIPGMGAENDVVGAFSVTPGVVTTGDQGGQLYVRGGTPIQNKVLLDGMTIYNPFHSIGFFSIFETELIKNVDIYTGGFSSKYGGRISSIMDITYRDGNKKDFGGKVSVSPFIGKLVLEGPIWRSKTNGSAASYVFSAKHSLLDYTSKTLYRGINDGNGLPYNFTDLYGKVTIAANGGSKFSFYGFHNNDKVNYNEVANLSFQQAGGGMSFVLVPAGSPTFIKGHLNASNYSTTFQEVGAFERNSKIFGADLGFDFSYFLKNESQMDYGINMNIFTTNYLTYNEAASKIEAVSNTTEIGAYFNYKLVTNRFVIQPGFRVQAYASLATVSPEPRLGVKFNATENFRLKFSGGRYSQNFTSASSDRDVVNLFNGLLSAPTNVQQSFITQFNNTKNPKNGLQYSWHAILGAEYDLTKYLSLNIEGYYKYFPQLSNINVNKIYEDVEEFDDIDDVYKKDFLIESGQSYGVDVLLKYSKNRLFLWGVYSYGKSTRWDGFATYAPVFDRRHNINLVGTYVFGAKKTLEVNVRWNLGSGLPFTPTTGFYQNDNFGQGTTSDYTTSNSNQVGILLGDYNSKRLPFYHRLDITVKKQFKFKNSTQMEIVGAITNAYDRNNIFYVNRVTNKVIYQFPFLPSMGMSYKF